jgi:hypothetical protein
MKLSQQQLEELLHNAYLDYKKTNLYATCPYCGHDEFGISLSDNHVFNCFRKSHCGVTGNIYTLLSFLGKTKEFLGERQVNAFDQLSNPLQYDEDVAVIEQVDLPEITPPVFWTRLDNDPYLSERGFVPYQFRKFEVGRSRINKGYVTFLVRQYGKLVGYVGRSDKSSIEIKAINAIRKQKGEREYLRYNNSHTDFAMTLFGLDELVDNVTTDVILVEGIFSKTKTDVNLGLDFDEHIKCCATLGAKLSDHQIQLLQAKGIKRLIFWFEADVLQKIKVIVGKAIMHFEVLVCYLGDNDPNDFDSEQAFATLQNAQNWLDFNTSYVRNTLRE